MFISLASTSIQNFSNWHALFVFYHILYPLRHGVGYRWSILNFFITRCAGNPQTIFVSLGSWKNIYILGIHPKKIIIPVPFHSKAFVLLYKFETKWALLGRLCRLFVCLFFFFAISGANFKHSLFMILSGLGSLIMWELPCWVSYFVSLKTILAALFRTFGIPFVSCLQNLHFSMIILPPTLGFFQIFSSFYNR